jgi:copper(I)-binding protein
MFYKQTLILLSFLICTLATSFSFAENIKFNGLIISNFWIKEPIGNHSITSGYFTIKNTNSYDETLIAITTNFAKKSEIHEMIVDNDIMKMNVLNDGLKIPANSIVHLKPGSYHVMFMKLYKKLKIMSTHQINLNFEKTGQLNVPFPVYKKFSDIKFTKHH